jgi:hypothetical protein
MTVRKSMLGLTVVCALLFGAFAAANASAAEGTTTFTCSSTATVKEFSDADCTTKPGTAFGHTAIPAGTVTPTTATGTTSQVLKGVISGVEIEITCTAEAATGSGVNKEVPPMDASGSEIVIKYTGCTVTRPAGKGCVVKGGAITTNKLKSTTSLTTSPAGVKFEPETGTEFVPITIEKCTVVALNGTFPVKGTEIAVPRGAFLDTSGSVGLTFAGNPATLTGSSTVKNTTSGTALVLTRTTS